MSILTTVKNAAGTVVKFGVAKSPVIFTGLAVAGVATIVGTLLKEAPAYTEAIEEHKKEMEAAEELHRNGANSDEEYKEARRKIRLAVAKKVALILLPTIISVAFTIACIVGSHKISMRRQAALAAAYSLLDKDSEEYKKKVEEIFGKKKADEVKQEIANDAVKKNPPPATMDNASVPNGGYWIFLKPLGRYIKSTIENVNKAENLVNQEKNLGGYVTVHQFLDFLDVDGCEGGESDFDAGWDENTGFMEIRQIDPIYVPWTPEPVMVLDWSMAVGERFLGGPSRRIK